MRPRSVALGLLLLVAAVPGTLRAQAPQVGKNIVVIRGQPQDVYFYPGTGEGRQGKPKVLFLPGDGGWRGFAVTLAQTLSSWGHDVYGLDTRRYLESFTGKKPLKESDVMNDLRHVADWMVQNRREPVILIGWSEGAGLCLLAAAAESNRNTFAGLVTIGLGESNVLGWRWSDFLSYITKKDPDEPKFSASYFLPKVAPLPVLMLQASHDEYVPVLEARGLFSVAAEPKRIYVVEAQNHRFDGNRPEFFRVLREGLTWMNQAAP